MSETLIPLARCFDKHCCLTITTTMLETLCHQQSKCNISSSLFSVFMQSLFSGSLSVLTFACLLVSFVRFVSLVFAQLALVFFSHNLSVYIAFSSTLFSSLATPHKSGHTMHSSIRFTPSSSLNQLFQQSCNFDCCDNVIILSVLCLTSYKLCIVFAL